MVKLIFGVSIFVQALMETGEFETDGTGKTNVINHQIWQFDIRYSSESMADHWIKFGVPASQLHRLTGPASNKQLFQISKVFLALDNKNPSLVPPPWSLLNLEANSKWYKKHEKSTNDSIRFY